jgi:hypothetical protein
MATTLPWGEQITVLMELGFEVEKFILGDYSTKVTRTNLLPNPNMDNSALATYYQAIRITESRSTDYTYSGDYSIKGVIDDASTVVQYFQVLQTAGAMIDVAAGQTYTFSAYIYLPTSNTTDSTWRAELYFWNGTSYTSAYAGTTTTITRGNWMRLNVTATVPAGYYKALPRLVNRNIAMAVGQLVYTDAWLLEASSTLRPYFDGSYADDWSGYILDGALSWSGTANASTSSATWGLIGTETSAAEPNGSLLDSFYLDGTLIGDDVSEYCRQVTINRGRPDQLQNFNAGTCSITLNNFDRRFDPTNQDSPYWNPVTGKSGVTPRRKVTVLSGGVELFTGRITDIDISYEPNQPDAGIDNSSVVITASDDFVLLANTYIGNAITPSEQLSGARVTSILDLDEVNYPATRDIDTGTATLGGGATFEIAANTNVLTYLQNVATAEQGYFFVAANGDLTFTDRVSASFASNSASFADTGFDIPYTSLSVLYGQEFLYNKIVATIVDGTDQTANDVASQTEFGVSTLNLSDLLLASDAAAATLASELLDRYKEPQYRFDRLQTLYNALDTTDQATITALELADVISITRTYPTGSPASVTQSYSIEALRHTITPSEHRVEIQLAVADLVYPFILDDATYGVMDSTNALT